MDFHRCLAHEALDAVLSDDHNAQAGEVALRGIVARVAAVEGIKGLQRLTVDFALKLAELTERIACGVPELGAGSLTSDDRKLGMIRACRCGCCT
jgi:hypothetical protein